MPEPNGAAPPLAEQRAIIFLAKLGRLAVRLAVVALAAGIVVWLVLARSVDAGDRAVMLTLAGLLLAAPPAILLLFSYALAALRSLPQRIREAPTAVRQRATEIQRRAGDVGARKGFIGGIGSIVRLWRSVASARELVQILGPAALLVTPWMLLATALAVAGALLQIVIGAIGLVVLGFT